MAAANANNPHDLAFAGHCTALVKILLGDFGQAEAKAATAVELSEKHQFPNEAAISRCILGQARAQLGWATEGVALLRQGIAGMLEAGHRHGVASFAAFLATAQVRAGDAVAEALETVELALTDFDEPVFRPEALRIRGELRLKQAENRIGRG